jgi:hypothetical protein
MVSIMSLKVDGYARTVTSVSWYSGRHVDFTSHCGKLRRRGRGPRCVFWSQGLVVARDIVVIRSHFDRMLNSPRIVDDGVIVITRQFDGVLNSPRVVDDGVIVIRKHFDRVLTPLESSTMVSLSSGGASPEC